MRSQAISLYYISQWLNQIKILDTKIAAQNNDGFIKSLLNRWK